jgi:hypothetical protein
MGQSPATPSAASGLPRSSHGGGARRPSAAPASAARLLPLERIQHSLESGSAIMAVTNAPVASQFEAPTQYTHHHGLKLRPYGLD